jgi:hypothetical protein
VAGPRAPQVWEQQPDESARAYAAFVAYRDLGSDRSVDAAYAAMAGHREGPGGAPKGTKRAPGSYKKWSAKHRWAARARAYDEHQAALRQKGIEQVTVKAGREWAERRDQQLRVQFTNAQLVQRQGGLLANMPVVTQQTQKDGQVVIFEAADPDTIRIASVVLKNGAEMAWDAIDRGLAIETGIAAEQARMEAAARPPGETSAADRILEDWRDAKRRTMITYDPARPPGGPAADAPEPGPEAPRRNGSGVPPVPASST